MFTAKILQVRVLQNVFDALKDFIQDARWYCSEDGMTLQCMDPGHVVLCNFTIRSDSLEYYRCDRRLVLGLNVSTIVKMLKCARENDVLTLTCDEQADRLKLSFETPKGERRAEYEMVLLDIEEDCLIVDHISYDVRLCLPSNEFNRICQNLSRFGDVIEISSQGEDVSFLSRGDVGNALIVYRQTCTDSGRSKVKLVASGTATLQLPTRHVCVSAKATELTSYVVLEMMDNSHLVVRYDFEQFGQMVFYLAAKIEYR